MKLAYLNLISGICLTNGLPAKSTHNPRHATPTRMFIAPSTLTVSSHSWEMIAIPRLPMKTAKQLINATAEPVSSSCCSSIRFAPGGSNAASHDCGRKEADGKRPGLLAAEEVDQQPSRRYKSKSGHDDERLAQIMASIKVQREPPRHLRYCCSLLPPNSPWCRCS